MPLRPFSSIPVTVPTALTKQRTSLLHRHRNVTSLLNQHLSRDLFNLLVQAGKHADERQVSLYLVGGYVRDLLLNIQNFDIDLVVEGNGIAFAKTFAKHHAAHVTIHDRFGTATLTCLDTPKIDMATARTEYYKFPAALPTVEPSSITHDLLRRDFTINTLAICLHSPRFGDLIDSYGGQRDLHDKTIRVLHSLSFIEDPTRVFRAFRFQQRVGFHLDHETKTLIKEAVNRKLFESLSKSRLLNELIALLSEQAPRKALSQLEAFDLLQCVHPQLQWSSQLNRVLKAVEESLEWYTGFSRHHSIESWVVYWMALMDRLPKKAVIETLARLPVPQHQAKKMHWIGRETTLVLRQLSTRPTPTPAQLYRMLCDLPDEALIYVMAKSQSAFITRQISTFLTTYQHMRPVLNGHDLQAMGLTPGPHFRNILDKLLDARLNGEVTTESEECTFVRQLVQTP